MDTLRVALWAALVAVPFIRLHICLLGVPLCVPVLTLVAVAVFATVGTMVTLLVVKMIREGFWLSRAVA